jgi:hypothetical protein
MQAYGLGAQYGVLLPYSRSQESEADHIGMILMAKAGYNPEATLTLWQRMEQLNDKAPPEFLSTHPSAGTRQQDIRRWLPEANRYYHPDPNLTIATLPTLAELEIGADHGETACQRYARNFNNKAATPQAQRLLTEALARTLEVPSETVQRRALSAETSFGDVAVASALAKAGAGSFDDVMAAHKSGKGWATIAKNDDRAMKDALGLLRAALVEARTLARQARQQGR